MISYIIGTMFTAGVVGGLINFFMSDPNIEKPLAWWEHIIIGVGAAFMIPLFLSMSSSQLISGITGTELTSDTFSKLLILTGLCLVAAVSSRAFIRSLAAKVLLELDATKKEAKEANAKAENAQVIAEANANMEPEVKPTQEITSKSLAPMQVSELQHKILQTMLNSDFAMRSLSGIAQDAQLDTADVNRVIGEMLQKQLIVEGKNRDGQLRWYPTATGRQAVDGA